MIKWEIRVLLTHYLEQGLSKAGIARQLGITRRTINRWIAGGQLERDVDTGQVRPPVRRSKPAKLEAFKPIIEARLQSCPELSVVRLFEEVRAAGYTGGLTQLKLYVTQVRPKPAPEPLVRFETEPGHQAQVDFAEFTFPWGKRYALSTVLTSNKSFEEWGEIFGDEVMAAALIDRLLHHCHIVNIRGNSFRMRAHSDLWKQLHPNGDSASASTPPPKRHSKKELTTYSARHRKWDISTDVSGTSVTGVDNRAGDHPGGAAPNRVRRVHDGE